MPTQTYEISAPTLGLHWEMPSSMLPPQASPRCRNVRLESGEVRKRHGLAQYGSTLAADIMLLYTYRLYDGTVYPVAVSIAEIYVHNGTDWQAKTAGWTLGTIDKPVYAVTYGDDFFVTNGVDAMKKYDGPTGALTNFTATIPGPETVSLARSLAFYAEHMFLIAPTEGGSVQQQRVRWDNVGSLGATWNSGTAGFVDTVSSPGGCLHALGLGNAMALYKTKSIVLVNWVGGIQVFVFETVIPDAGCLAGRTVADIEIGRAHV